VVQTLVLEALMHESTLDLFCTHADDNLDIDDAFMCAFEEEASKLEITVDYYMAEFL
jgi:hypothetical protein